MVCAMALSACVPTPTPAATVTPIRIVPQGTILFSATGSDGVFALYTMNADGSNRKPLYRAARGDLYGARWSPDGRTAVATLEVDGGSQLWLIDADGTHARPLTTLKASGEAAWAPDGAALVFVSNDAGQKDLYYIRADGTGLRRLTTRKGDHEQPTWSPDGSRIAFVSTEDSQFGNRQLMVLEISLTGAAEQKFLLRNERVNFQYPVFSHDGKKLAYASDATGVFDLYVLTLETGKSIALTQGTEPATHPTWSPDDALLAYTVNLPRGFTLHLITAQGAGATPIDLRPDVNEFFPDWKR